MVGKHRNHLNELTVCTYTSIIRLHVYRRIVVRGLTRLSLSFEMEIHMCLHLMRKLSIFRLFNRAETCLSDNFEFLKAKM